MRQNYFHFSKVFSGTVSLYSIFNTVCHLQVRLKVYPPSPRRLSHSEPLWGRHGLFGHLEVGFPVRLSLGSAQDVLSHGCMTHLLVKLVNVTHLKKEFIYLT